ncbi:MAG: hypothetical protein J6L64_04625 [Opitutales bacterium]|nr:hypothetical protein [Opitutales bacterium]
MKTRTNLLAKSISTLASLFVLSGCASIVSDTTYPVTVGTFVPNAKFTVKDERSGNIVHMGTTPQSVVLSSSSGFFQAAKYKIEVEKDGYQKGYHYLNAEIEPWYFGNLIFGGLIGLIIVDPLTGAMWKLPEYVTVGLYPLPSQDTHAVVEEQNLARESSVKRTAKGVKHEAPPQH